MPALSWITNNSFLFTATELVTTSTTVSASGSAITYSVISGALPGGLQLSSTGVISGAPNAVNNVTRSKFVIRASGSQGLADKTFYIDVAGADDPIWVTDEGYLPVGVSGEDYALNNQWLDYSVSANPYESTDDSKIVYYIADGDGKLPPGIQLTSTGRLYGFIKDRLTFVSAPDQSGGYDDESYDGYSYDHAIGFFGELNPTLLAGAAKIYQFRITATDGINSSKRLFKIVVSSIDILKYNTTSMPIDIVLSTGTIQLPQFINGTDLGTIRAQNNQIIPVTVYDPDPLAGTVTYSVVPGMGILANLPDGLSLSSDTGYLYGFVPYQPAYTRNYSITINAVKTETGTSSFVTVVNTFTLAVKGEVENSIQWVSNSILGTIETGVTSELAVVANHVNSEYSIKYQLTDGVLPPGLTLQRDGSISGKASYNYTGTYIFTVQAGDVYELSATSREFRITVVESSTKQYSEMYFKPFLSREKRKIYQDFMSNEFVFDPKLMYRYYDPVFGVQSNIRMMLEFGIEKLDIRDYTVALRENFYRRRFWFGDVKVAIAKDSTGAIVYELVYVDVADELVNNAGISVSPVVYNKNNIYYPASIDNMRRQMKLLVLDDYSYISINEYSLPRFMRTPQAGYYKPPSYMRVIPLCYALPGQGSKIVSRIRLSKFDFKLIDFEVDRLIIQDTEDNSTAKYLLLARQVITDTIESDQYLYGTDSVLLEQENTDPIIRE